MDFEKKISMILKTNKLQLVTREELSEFCGFNRDTIRKAIERKTELGDRYTRIFQDKLNINPAWWDTGEGDIYLSNNTQVQKTQDIKQNEKTPRETFYLDLIENNVEYNLIPRAVLKDYKMVPDKIIDVIISSAENEKRALREAMDEAKTSLIQKYESIIEGKNHRIEELLKLNDELRKQIPT